MLIDVALTPALLKDPTACVCVVVDVLRASSACVMMFESGVKEVAVAANPEIAHALRTEVLPDALLCGEVGGLPPEGFDYGNSPLEFSRLDLRGRRAVLATSNGTRALHAVAHAPAVLVGCLLNRAAVAEAAIEAAFEAGVGVTVVCAGNDYGATYSLDDAMTAGAIVSTLHRAGRTEGPEQELSDAALTSLRLFEVYERDLAQAFREGVHGRGLQRLGFGEDLDFCAQIDRSRSVPFLAREAGNLLMLRLRSAGAAV
jgi:2-phosphosulfolactate phosphatase